MVREGRTKCGTDHAGELNSPPPCRQSLVLVSSICKAKDVSQYGLSGFNAVDGWMDGYHIGMDGWMLCGDG